MRARPFLFKILMTAHDTALLLRTVQPWFHLPLCLRGKMDRSRSRASPTEDKGDPEVQVAQAGALFSGRSSDFLLPPMTCRLVESSTE